MFSSLFDVMPNAPASLATPFSGEVFSIGEIGQNLPASVPASFRDFVVEKTVTVSLD